MQSPAADPLRCSCPGRPSAASAPAGLLRLAPLRQPLRLLCLLRQLHQRADAAGRLAVVGMAGVPARFDTSLPIRGTGRRGPSPPVR